MKGKLIKDHDEYVLINDERFVIATTDTSMLEVTDKMKLSKQNCDEIFRVVDVENLACEEIKIHIDAYKIIHRTSTEKGASPCTPLNEGGCVGANLYSQVNGFIKGFNKAMELNKDKQFTEQNLREIYSRGILGGESVVDRYIKALQPTEIEVEIETETKVWEFISNGEFESFEIIPKLDSNGCLILKKK